MVSYAVNLVGLVVQVAAPPAGWTYWVGVSASGVGTTWSYFSVVDGPAAGRRRSRLAPDVLNTTTITLQRGGWLLDGPVQR